LRIVRLYYYYSKWLSDNSNCKVVELDFLTKEGNVQLSNCTSKFQLAPYLSATVITLHSSINRRLKWKKWLLFYHCV
jgi:hypothetical protein